MDRLFEVFQAHNIRHFTYLGGNDSQDTSLKIHEEALKRGFDLRVIGVPKTIDNDLACTDNCPGYGSVVKFNATTVMEIGLDVGSMATDDGACCLVEVMGRRAGWIAASTVLAKQGQPAKPPHIVLLPEVAFDEEKFLGKVKETVAALKYCIVVVGEGLKNAAGQEVGADHQRLDAFGHPVLAGAAERLQELVQGKLNIKARAVMLSYAQRAAAHWASRTDADNAFACGEAAVRAAVGGRSGQMVGIVRLVQPDGSTKWDTGLQPLTDIANVERLVPRDWISEDGLLPNERFVEYARPLIEGEVRVPTDGGLPRYVALEKSKVEKKLAPLSRS
jgi:6-phosphofructokinase 1